MCAAPFDEMKAPPAGNPSRPQLPTAPRHPIRLEIEWQTKGPRRAARRDTIRPPRPGRRPALPPVPHRRGAHPVRCGFGPESDSPSRRRALWCNTWTSSWTTRDRRRKHAIEEPQHGRGVVRRDRSDFQIGHDRSLRSPGPDPACPPGSGPIRALCQGRLLFFAQLETEGAEVVVQLLQRSRPDDRAGDGRAGQQPG